MLTISFLILTLSLGKGSFSEDETLKSLGEGIDYLSDRMVTNCGE